MDDTRTLQKDMAEEPSKNQASSDVEVRDPSKNVTTECSSQNEVSSNMGFPLSADHEEPENQTLQTTVLIVKGYLVS